MTETREEIEKWLDGIQRGSHGDLLEIQRLLALARKGLADTELAEASAKYSLALTRSDKAAGSGDADRAATASDWLSVVREEYVVALGRWYQAKAVQS